jgi:uncharacterized protein YjiS (DUF1127 family)
MEATMSSNTRALSLQSQSSAGLAQSLWTRWEDYWTRRAKRATVDLLRGLDDRVLHDIGIDRSEIESVVYGRGADRLVRCRAI